MISPTRGGRCVAYICPEANKKFTRLLFTRVRAPWLSAWRQAGGLPGAGAGITAGPRVPFPRWNGQPSGRPPDGGGYLSFSS